MLQLSDATFVFVHHGGRANPRANIAAFAQIVQMICVAAMRREDYLHNALASFLNATHHPQCADNAHVYTLLNVLTNAHVWNNTQCADNANAENNATTMNICVPQCVDNTYKHQYTLC